MSRWVPEEEVALKALKKRLKRELAEAPQFPELVGDRRLLRFLRGRDLDVELAAGMFINHLNWRKEYNVDDIRKNIAYRGCNQPSKFPHAATMLRLAPQNVIAPYARDYQNQPIVLECYGAISPKEIFQAIKIEEYIEFLIYTLEFRSMILEQLSEEMEQDYLRRHPNPSMRSVGYGVILRTCVIRCLKGLGMSHMTFQCKIIIQKALELATANYQEFLGKSHMINVPWVFNVLWQFIKGRGLLEPR